MKRASSDGVGGAPLGTSLDSTAVSEEAVDAEELSKRRTDSHRRQALRSKTAALVKRKVDTKGSFRSTERTDKPEAEALPKVQEVEEGDGEEEEEEKKEETVGTPDKPGAEGESGKAEDVCLGVAVIDAGSTDFLLRYSFSASSILAGAVSWSQVRPGLHFQVSELKK